MMSGVSIVDNLKQRRTTVLIALLVLLVACAATWAVIARNDTTTRTAPQPPAPSSTASLSEGASNSPSATGASADASATSSASASASAASGECSPVGEGFEPVRYTLEDPSVDAKVISLGTDAEGNIAAPPKDQPRTASWWNQGPRAGADKGKTVLSIHTYRNGGAVGNMLYEGGRNQLEPGTMIKLYGADGQVACYEFVEATKVWVEDYDPDSTVMVDYEGNPLLTIIICWDLEQGTDFWASRIFFYFKPVTS